MLKTILINFFVIMKEIFLLLFVKFPSLFWIYPKIAIFASCSIQYSHGEVLLCFL